MSILNEILSTGHVEEELLAALDDEQKQLLFCQMRAEQVRKWELAETEWERNRPLNRSPKKKSLRWLTGTDGDVWVWVMGDHEEDKTIEEILEDESREKAHSLAIRELRSIGSDSDEDALMVQLGRLQVGAPNHDNYDNVYSNGSPGTSHFLLFQPPKTQSSQPQPQQQPQPIVTTTTVSSYSTPQPQKAQLIRGERPPLLPKPGYFATFSSNPQPSTNSAMDPQFPVNNQSTNGFSHPWEQNGSGSVNNGVRMREPRIDDGRREEEVQKRESEILQSLLEERERIQREAEICEDREKALWEEQERKSREAENAHRELAQKAREKHQQMIRTSTSILPALKDHKAGSLREAIRNLPRPPKPKSRAAIIDWFQREELPRGTGLDPKTRAPAPWFHGIISREQSEVLLTGKPTGSFLVRVSERIWGYTVSYAARDGTFKHFLVEKIPEGYQFLGTNQVVHDQLFDLVSYHETAPITAKGVEVLKWAVSQNTRPADYADLIPEPANTYPSYSSRSVIRTIPTTILNGPVGRF
uniref:SH2 domain-containing protein n=1 Tax=Caenorhabditis japonica TaxID=281687 RepID=A0A8R1HW54_CAEJA